MRNLIFFIICTGFFCAFNQSITAQEEPVANKVFYTEFGGGGMIMSMNFDQRFIPNSKLGFGYRIGVGFGIGTSYVENDEYLRTFYSVPVGLNYVFGKPNSASSFEIGGGITYLTRERSIDFLGLYEEKYSHFIGFVNFMYRRVPVKGGFSFRIGLSPLINATYDLVPMGAVGFGYAF